MISGFAILEMFVSMVAVSLGNGTPGLRGLLTNFYTDHFFSGITYLRRGKDLYVIDEVSAKFDDTAPVIDGVRGAMKIKDFAFAYTYLGSDQAAFNYTGEGQSNPSGDLGMVFKRVNPIAAILALLPPTAIGTALGGAAAQRLTQKRPRAARTICAVAAARRPVDINHIKMVAANEDDFCRGDKTVTDVQWKRAA